MECHQRDRLATDRPGKSATSSDVGYENYINSRTNLYNYKSNIFKNTL